MSGRLSGNAAASGAVFTAPGFGTAFRRENGTLPKAQSLPEMIDNDFPAMGKAYRELDGREWSEVRSITMERHYALNWLCGLAPNNQWDATPTDT